MSYRKKRPKYRNAAKDRAPDTPPASDGIPVQVPVSPSGDADAPVVPGASEIQRLISKGDVKTAVNKAKRIHKQLGTAESEKILLDAYLARIDQMNANGLTTEAGTLLDLVKKRFGCADPRMTQLSSVITLHAGHIDRLVAPLSDPDLPADQRAVIEKTIQNELVDLSLLVRCNTLPSGHPLKTGAADVMKAFSEVTSGTVGDETLALPAISRRSPLAPWKMLVRAIALFYRRDDEKCETCLQAIEPDSAPARVVPAIRQMLGTEQAGTSGDSVLPLHDQVNGNDQKLRNALLSLDKAVSSRKLKKLLPVARSAVDACKDICPEWLDRLKQNIAVRLWSLDFNTEEAAEAIEGPSVKNAYFWLLIARAAETRGQPLLACAMWAEFRKHALHEGWFPDRGPEVATLFIHMVHLLQEIPAEKIEWQRNRFTHSFKGLAPYYHNQPTSVTAAALGYGTSADEMYFLDPEALFRLASKNDPVRETFQSWLAWIESRERHWKQSDPVALAWNAAIPDDPKPLLFLMKSAEKRGAYSKALRYLEKAECIDGLDPAVRSARLRLLTANAIRHLKQKKTHLIQTDIAALEGLPSAGDIDRTAFVLALKSACAMIDKDKPRQLRWNGELAAHFHYPLTARMVAQGVLAAGGMSRQKPLFPSGSIPPLAGNDLVAAVAAGCKVGDNMGLAVAVPRVQEKALVTHLTQTENAPDASAMRIIAETALRDNQAKLAYAAAGAGLLQVGPQTARLLLLRARSLPAWERKRWKDCINAAISLARRERDLPLIDEALRTRREKPGFPFGLPSIFDAGEQDAGMDPEGIARILAHEKASRKYPPFRHLDPFEDWIDADDEDEDHSDCRHCDAPDCESRTAPYIPDEAFDDPEAPDGEDLDFDALPPGFLDKLIPGMNGEIASLLLDAAMRHGRGGLLPDIDELVKSDPGLMDKIVAAMLNSEVGMFNPKAGRRRSKRGRK